MHDGAYLRLGLGFGATLGSARVGSTDLTSSGLGLALEIAAGWAPIPGLVIGGEMSPTGSLSQTVSGGGVNKANTGGLLSFFFGPFVDFYPYPTKGFHVEAGVGLGAMIWSKGPEATIGGNPQIPAYDYSGGGIGFKAGIGYEAWVSPNWGMGALLRIVGASGTMSAKADSNTGKTGPDVKMTMWAPGILFTSTYQ